MTQQLKQSPVSFGIIKQAFALTQCSGCRADANEAAVILLPSNITVFTLDFSGSGLSGGDYVSLGWHEVYIGICVVIHLFYIHILGDHTLLTFTTIYF